MGKLNKTNASGNQRGLARKGSKNLKKTVENGVTMYENQYGVKFTEAEKKQFESAVNSAMAKRRKILQDQNDLTRKIFGVKQNYKVGDDFESNDFIMAKKTKSLQRFRSKQMFETYKENVDRVRAKDYIPKRLDRYKQNYLKAIEGQFGVYKKDENGDYILAKNGRKLYDKNSDGYKAFRKLKSMSTKDFAEFMQSELFSGLQYIYNDEEYDLRLEGLNSMLGVE